MAAVGAGTPVTETVDVVPIELVVVTVNRSVAPTRLGVTVAVAKPQLAPAGSPLHDRVTDCARPFTKVAVIVVVAEPVVPVLMPATGALFASE